MPPTWRKSLLREDAQIDQRLSEIALALAIRDALRSGDLYLPESRRHVSFCNLVYDENQWTQARCGVYEQLSLFPRDAEQLCEEVLGLGMTPLKAPVYCKFSSFT